ncbi:MAG: MFS transporter [Candidatus Nanopelagicales bacterium]|nr:MFS transporter [Candidatus Nanopelagicales bacterium]
MPLRSARAFSPAAVIAVLAVSGMAVSLMQTLLVPLLADLPEILHASVDDVSWVVTATLLSSAVATPTLSRLADMFGKKRMMLVCLGLLLIGSIIGALSSSLVLIIVARVFQGTASALIPIGMSIMRDELPKEQLSAAVALMSATLGIGAALGLPLSGVVYEAFGWHAIFWVSGIFAIAMAIAIAIVIRESAVRTGGSFDYVGAILLSGALTALLLGISKGGSWGWTSTETLLTFGVSAGVFAMWTPWEFRSRQPLVDLRVSLRRSVLMTNMTAVLMGFAMYANMLSTIEMLEMPAVTGYGHGLSSLEAGLAMIPTCLTMVVLAPVSARITHRFGAKTTLITGALIMAIGYVARIFMHDTVTMIVIAAVIVSAGTAVSFAAMPILIMGAVPETETAAANGLNTLLRSIGASVSSAAIAGILAVVTLSVAGRNLPSLAAFQLVFVLAALASFIGALIAMAIPKAEFNDLEPIDPDTIAALTHTHEVTK